MSETNEEGEKVLTMEDQSNQIVKRYMLWSLGAGAIPIPWIDMAAVMGVQIKMIKDLADHYEVPFKESRGKSIIASLVGSLTAGSLKTRLFGGLLKAVPVAGTVLGAAGMSVFSAATSYAVGKVFIQHFEAGGTFLDMDPEKVKDYFREQYAEGKEKAKKMAKKEEE